ncbi:hypothetical protein [Pedobacter mucosus]|uniref:hypothetical protein n=1 Tax=Pedobacter mucosus TaxID=2895286 RepID=UPI001EE44C79|nr:hypothetical protein [Pedobacter mucosus]UKT63055.1 hypothetical protein LOK61_14910 [Pedobacter mucosus]
MNYQKQKSNPAFRAFQEVLKRIGEDRSLFATHVSLFTAMFICWQKNAFLSPFMVNRKMLMTYSKIASKATYHKCIRELQQGGYIGYRPSFHPILASQVWWLQGGDLENKILNNLTVF